MVRTALLVIGMTLGASPFQPASEACGDKFLMVGRGARFQRAYASLNPGRVVIYARPSTSSRAPIRDPQLHRVLRQAGHAVSVIEDFALLEQALRTVPVDTLLVDAAEAPRLQPVLPSATSHPTTIYVAAAGQPVPPDVVCRLKESDRPLRYLEEIEQAMKTRKGQSPKS
jgi:hypothetical protein